MIFDPKSSAQLENLKIYVQSGVSVISSCFISPYTEIRSGIEGKYADSVIMNSFIGAYCFMAPGEYKSLILGNYCHLGEKSKTL